MRALACTRAMRITRARPNEVAAALLPLPCVAVLTFYQHFGLSSSWFVDFFASKQHIKAKYFRVPFLVVDFLFILHHSRRCTTAHRKAAFRPQLAARRRRSRVMRIARERAASRQPPPSSTEPNEAFPELNHSFAELTRFNSCECRAQHSFPKQRPFCSTAVLYRSNLTAFVYFDLYLWDLCPFFQYFQRRFSPNAI